MAENIAELNAGLAEAGDATMFYHTFQTIRQYHFLTEGFSNDFAQWVLASLNQPALAERLASIDIRDYLSIQELRSDLRRILGEFCDERPTEATNRAFEPFYFCEAVEVVIPLHLGCADPAGFSRRPGTAEPRVVLSSLHLFAAPAATAYQRFFPLVPQRARPGNPGGAHRPHRCLHEHARYRAARTHRAGGWGDWLMIVSVETQTATLDQYVPLLGAAEVDELRTLAEPLEGSTVDMVNSTAVGGGVAELLSRILAVDAGAGTRYPMACDGGQWRFLRCHQSVPQCAARRRRILGGEHGFEIFRELNRLNRERIPLDGRFVVIHDPQPAPFIEARQESDAATGSGAATSIFRGPIPRCGISWNPGCIAMMARFSPRPAFARQLPVPQYLFYPAIDPLADKNIELEPEFVERVLELFSIDSKRPSSPRSRASTA